MSTVRLTNLHRSAILSLALDHAFKKKWDALAKEENDLAVAAYNSYYNEELREKLNAIPKEWLNYDNYMNFAFGYKQITLKLISQTLPNPHKMYSPRIIKDQDLIQRFENWSNEKENLSTLRNKAKLDLQTLLGSVTTLNKLEEIWPEGNQFYCHLKFSSPKTLPAIQISQINSLLGLSPCLT